LFSCSIKRWIGKDMSAKQLAIHLCASGQIVELTFFNCLSVVLGGLVLRTVELTELFRSACSMTC